MSLVSIDQALQVLSSGEVLGLPTETVYGLAARIDSESALKKIFATKQRPFFDPLIVHLSQNMDPKDFCLDWPQIYQALTKKFWPGPLTLIAPKNKKISNLITAGLPNVGLRSPNHPIAQELIQKFGIPLAAPSANMFGKTSPTKAEHVLKEFLGKVPVLDGGPCIGGVESTVAYFNEGLSQLEILRPGLISIDQLREVAKDFTLQVVYGSSSSAPGQLKTHYQPNCPVVLQFTKDKDLTEESQRGFEKQLGSESALQWKTLVIESDPRLAARNLYSQLREQSESPASALWIPLPPEVQTDEEWRMILDRLGRAASIVQA